MSAPKDKPIVVGVIVGTKSSITSAGTKRYQVVVRQRTRYASSAEPEEYEFDVDRQMYDLAWSEMAHTRPLHVELRLVEYKPEKEFEPR